MKSYYVLEMFVGPGGSRQAISFISGESGEIQAAFDGMMRNCFNLYHLVFYGQDIFLSAYQEGEKKQTVDLLPHIQVEFKAITIDKKERDVLIRFNGSHEARAYDKQGNALDTKIDWDDPEWEEVSGNCFGDELVYGKDFLYTSGFEFTKDIYPLTGDLLSKGDDARVEYHSHYMNDNEIGRYGVDEIELGEYLGDFEEFMAMVQDY